MISVNVAALNIRIITGAYSLGSAVVKGFAEVRYFDVAGRIKRLGRRIALDAFCYGGYGAVV